MQIDCRSTLKKILSSKANKALFSKEKAIFSGTPKEEGFPHLSHRPWERGLKSYNEFKAKLAATEKSPL